MTLEVVSDEARKILGIRDEYVTETISAFRAEHKIGETDKLKLLFAIRQKNIGNSHVQILIPGSLSKTSERGNPGFAGYSLSVSHILQLANDAPGVNPDASGDVIPTADQVKSVSIKFKHPKLKDVEFNAAAGDWKAIRSNLLPAEPDPKPAKWAEGERRGKAERGRRRKGVAKAERGRIFFLVIAARSGAGGAHAEDAPGRV